MKMLGDTAVQTPAVTTARCKHQMPEARHRPRQEMANENAKSHRSADDGSKNCTVQASIARNQA